MEGWQQLTDPAGIAVIGASPNSRITLRLLGYLRRFGFSGGLVAVNPQYTEVDGVPCVATMSEVPFPVDLAVIAVRADRVVDAVREAALRGVRAAIVISSGFAEVGPAGAVLQRALEEVAAEHRMLVLGPNCQGLVFAPTRLAATFSAAFAQGFEPTSGLAYLGQSGALGGSYLSLVRERGLGVSAWFTTGNQAGLSVTAAASMLLGEDSVSVLSIYLESVPGGAEWLGLLQRAAELGKRIVVLRSGRSEMARQAAQSHTGALISHSQAFEIVTADLGVPVTGDFDEFIHRSVMALRPPTRRGRHVAVITTSGGAGSLAADALQHHELAAPEPTERSTLEQLIPAFGSARNPFDVTAQIIDDRSMFKGVCTVVVRDDVYDSVLFVVTSVGGDEAVRLGRGIVGTMEGSDKAAVVVWLFGTPEIADAVKVLSQAGIPVVGSLEQAARLLEPVTEPAAPTPSPDSAPPAMDGPALRGLLASGVVTEAGGAALLDALGIPRPRGTLVRQPHEAAEVAGDLGGRVVVKLQSPDIVHKTEMGAVQVGVDPSEVETVTKEMLSRCAAMPEPPDVLGILVQELGQSGIELVVGIQGAENGYPPVVMVGFGGAGTEVDPDTSVSTAPVSTERAGWMLESLRGWALLDGWRGGPPADVSAVAAAVAALSGAAVELGEDLLDLEINPLIVLPDGQGAYAADFLLRFRPEAPAGQPGEQPSAAR